MDVLDREYDWFLGEKVGEPGAKGLMKPAAKSLRLELFHRGPTEQGNEVRIGRVLDPPQELGIRRIRMVGLVREAAELKPDGCSRLRRNLLAQARLADARLSDHRHSLAAPGIEPRQSIHKRPQLRFAPN